MIDLEARVRDGLDAAARAQRVPPEFDERVTQRISVVRRRRRAGRSALAAIVLVAMAGGLVALRDDSNDPRMVAGAPTTGPGWHAIAKAPIPARFQALSLAMGDRMLVWGGSIRDGVNDGAVYDARDDRWTKVPAAPLPSGDAVGAWDGIEAIVLAGDSGDVAAAAYDPDRNSWRKLADPPLQNAASAMNHAVWAGTELVVLGVATEVESVTTSQVAIYDPVADVWRTGTPTSAQLPDFGDAVWTGKEIAVVGRVGDSGRGPGTSTVNLYDPATDRWRSIPWGLDGQRSNPVVVWTGDRLFVGGGEHDRARLRDAALVDLGGNWERLPDAPVGFAGNQRFGELWTGTSVLSLNGDGGQPVTFTPATGEWAVGTPDSTGGRRDEVDWTWLPAVRAAVVWGGGSASDVQEGMVSCCTPIEGGERYTP